MYNFESKLLREEFTKKCEESETKFVCQICSKNYLLGDEITTIGCGHQFHNKCIESWLLVKTRCPVCLSYFRKSLIDA